MKKIKVALGERSYNIIIKENALGEIGSLLRKNKKISDKGMVITNNKVYKLYGEKFLKSLSSSGFKVKVIKVPDSEQAKSLSVAAECYKKMIKFSLNRSSFLIALGGGVVGDLTGFLAATYMRGIHYYQCPTTLLSQVDSSVGGKTAVNLPEGKNMVGCFYQPSMVIADLNTLKTLSLKNYRDGLSEVIKYSFINDKQFFNYLCKNIEAINKRDLQVLEKLISSSVKNKAMVVEEDENEKGLRAILNFGHTFGHAIEKTYNYKTYSHGQSVAIGMYMAMDASVLSGELSLKEAEKMKDLMNSLNLNYKLPEDKISTIIKNLSFDKKMTDKGLSFILLNSIGSSIQRGLTLRVLKTVITNYAKE